MDKFIKIKDILCRIFLSNGVKSFFITFYLFITPIILFAMFLLSLSEQNSTLFYGSIIGYCVLHELTRRFISKRLGRKKKIEELEKEIAQLKSQKDNNNQKNQNNQRSQRKSKKKSTTHALEGTGFERTYGWLVSVLRALRYIWIHRYQRILLSSSALRIYVKHCCLGRQSAYTIKTIYNIDEENLPYAELTSLHMWMAYPIIWVIAINLWSRKETSSWQMYICWIWTETHSCPVMMVNSFVYY